MSDAETVPGGTKRSVFQSLVLLLLSAGVVMQAMILMQLRGASVTSGDFMKATTAAEKSAIAKRIPMVSVPGTVEVSGSVDVDNTVEVSGSVEVDGGHIEIDQ